MKKTALFVAICLMLAVLTSCGQAKLHYSATSEAISEATGETTRKKATLASVNATSMLPSTTSSNHITTQTSLSTNSTTTKATTKATKKATVPPATTTTTNTKVVTTTSQNITTTKSTTMVAVSKDIVQGYVYPDSDSQLVVYFDPTEKVEKITVQLVNSTINSIDNPELFIWTDHHTKLIVSSRERNPDGTWLVTIGRPYLVTVEGTDILYDGTYWKKMN